MEVLKLGIQLELQLPAYTRATAMRDPSPICDLHHSSRQCQILNLLSEARDQTFNLMVPSRIHFCCAMMGIPEGTFVQDLFVGSVFPILSAMTANEQVKKRNIINIDGANKTYKILFFLVFLLFSWATPVAYGSSQARG